MTNIFLHSEYPVSNPSRGVQFLLIIVLTLACASRANAQETAPKGWLEFNAGGNVSAAGSTVFTFSRPLYQETTAEAAAYPKPSSGFNFDVGFGALVKPMFGLGFNFAVGQSKDVAGLGIVVPSPAFFNDLGSAGGTTGKLSRKEGAFNFQAVFVPVNRKAAQVRLSGGPTYFRYNADMVQDLQYSQVYSTINRTNVVSITGIKTASGTGGGWGFNVGGDSSYFFTRAFGVGAFARYTRGRASVADPLSELQQKVTVGGFQSGGGLRFRF